MLIEQKEFRAIFYNFLCEWNPVIYYNIQYPLLSKSRESEAIVRNKYISDCSSAGLFSVILVGSASLSTQEECEERKGWWYLKQAFKGYNEQCYREKGERQK